MSQLSFAGFEEQPDLPPGFVYQPQFLSLDEHDHLVAILDSWAFAEVRMRGVVARRSALHFGVSYNLQTNEIESRNVWPDELEWLKERASVLAEVPAVEFRQ